VNRIEKQRLRQLGLLGGAPGQGASYSAEFSARTFTEGEEHLACGGEDQVQWFRREGARYLGEDADGQ
jgi:hypothetical protein